MISNVRVLIALLSLSVISYAADTKSSDSSRPRGVGPEFAKFYKSTDKWFTCISNPALRIPFSQVNDDYCDCPDGSDEPGTAACSYLSALSFPQPRPDGAHAVPANATLVLPGFYCKNKGHLPSYVRFENVNDGRCDYEVCCDGSEEYAGVGGVKCEDRCAVIGKEWKKKEDARVKSEARAVKRRKELQSEADRAKKEVEDKIQATGIRIAGLERKVEESEENLREVERREKARIVRSDAQGKGSGRIGVLITLAKDRVVELRKTLDKTRQQRDSMFNRVLELEKVLADLKEEYNPNFNDAGVKKAVSSWEDYAARETTDHWTEAEDRDLNEIQKEDGSDSGVNWSDFETTDEEVSSSDAAAIYSLTSYLPPPLQSWLTGTISGFRKLLIDNGVLPQAPSSTIDINDSAAVKNARKTVDDTKRDLTNAQADLRRDQEDLDKDYGPAGIFRALKSKCVDKESGEYIYAHCFLDKTTQRPKKGGSETKMGSFVGFDTEYVDEDLPADGKGLGRGERVVIKYENGQHCWNGPSRSTRVVIGCSEEDEIWKISESEKCVYRMEVGSPSVCGWEKKKDGADVVGEASTKDEL